MKKWKAKAFRCIVKSPSGQGGLPGNNIYNDENVGARPVEPGEIPIYRGLRPQDLFVLTRGMISINLALYVERQRDWKGD